MKKLLCTLAAAALMALKTAEGGRDRCRVK